MKTLRKIHINSGKIMEDKELKTLRGGYGGWVNCGGTGPYCSGQIDSCDDETVRIYCNMLCPGWSGAVCVS